MKFEAPELLSSLGKESLGFPEMENGKVMKLGFYSHYNLVTMKRYWPETQFPCIIVT